MQTTTPVLPDRRFLGRGTRDPELLISSPSLFQEMRVPPTRFGFGVDQNLKLRDCTYRWRKRARCAKMPAFSAISDYRDGLRLRVNH
jgi:hypothetical protein